MRFYSVNEPRATFSRDMAIVERKEIELGDRIGFKDPTGQPVDHMCNIMCPRRISHLNLA